MAGQEGGEWEEGLEDGRKQGEKLKSSGVLRNLIVTKVVEVEGRCLPHDDTDADADSNAS